MFNPATVKERLTKFLTPTIQAPDDNKPAITQFYTDNYKIVDKFNQLKALFDIPSPYSQAGYYLLG